MATKLAKLRAQEIEETKQAGKRAKMSVEEELENREKVEVAKQIKEERDAKKKLHVNRLRARRIRSYPNSKQDEMLKRFFGVVRFCYNMLVEKYKNVGQGGVKLADFKATLKDGPEWLNEFLCELKDVAVRDFDKARKAHFAKLKKMKQRNPNAKLDAKFRFF